jgi:hypothetical protein
VTQRYFRTQPTWSLAPPALAIVVIFVGLGWGACATRQVQVDNPTELCAAAVSLSPSVKTQAAKLGLEPTELARRTCDAAILAAQVAEANLAKPSGTAGLTSSSPAPSMGLAGAAGSGG